MSMKELPLKFFKSAASFLGHPVCMVKLLQYCHDFNCMKIYIAAAFADKCTSNVMRKEQEVAFKS